MQMLFQLKVVYNYKLMNLIENIKKFLNNSSQTIEYSDYNIYD